MVFVKVFHDILYCVKSRSFVHPVLSYLDLFGLQTRKTLPVAQEDGFFSFYDFRCIEE